MVIVLSFFFLSFFIYSFINLLIYLIVEKFASFLRPLCWWLVGKLIGRIGSLVLSENCGFFQKQWRLFANEESKESRLVR